MKLLNPEPKRKSVATRVGVYSVMKKEDIEIGHPHNLHPLVATESKYITCPQCNEKIELEATK